METIQYRAGRPEECLRIAQGICLASGGIMDFLAQAMPTSYRSKEEWLAQELQTDQPASSYRHAVIAQVNGAIAGIVYCYPAALFGLGSEMKEALGEENYQQIAEFFSSRVENSLFLDSLYVWPAWRQRGIGAALIQQVMREAEASGLPKVSLMVMADNASARSVYRSCGFELEKAVRLERHPLIPHDGGALLLSVSLKR